MPIQPYLFFNGKCEEALAFYKQALGAEITMLMRFKDSPEPPPEGAVPPNWGDKVMHAAFSVHGSPLMTSDGGCGDAQSFNGFSLSLNVADEASVDKVFNALADGGKVQMAPSKTFWSPRFAMVTDRFGLGWMVGVEPTE